MVRAVSPLIASRHHRTAFCKSESFKSVNEGMKTLLLFSGGLDSTYSLYRLLQEGKGVDLLYADGGQHPHKRAAEEIARKEVLTRLSHHLKITSEFKTWEPRSTIKFGNSPSVGFSQVPAWLIASLEIVDPAIHDEVIVSYVAGDQAVAVLNDMRDAWYYLWRVAKVSSAALVPLNFHLVYMTKEDIVNQLPQEIVEATWVCETPIVSSDDYLPCGACPACKRRSRLFLIHEHETGIKLIDKWTLLKQTKDTYTCPTSRANFTSLPQQNS